MLPVIIAVLFVGLLIVIHEAGHYFAARWGGMRVNRFSIGFGPVLYKGAIGETQFMVSAIPFGGYVDIAGLNESDGTEPDDPRSYQNRSLWERFNAVLAGPVANYLAAFFLFWLYLGAFNVQFTGPFEVVGVSPDSAAAEAGLQTGDLIVSSPDAPLDDRRAVLEAIQNSGGEPLRLVIERGGEKREVAVSPKKTGGGYHLGIMFQETSGVAAPLGFVSGLTAAAERLWTETTGMVNVLASLVSAPSAVSKRLAGPVGIVGQLAQALETAPVAALLTVAKISIALGFFNLLPIPALDGSRLLFLLIGAVRRRPVPARLENTVHGIGFMLLLGLLLLVTWNDVMRWLAG